MNSVTSDEPTQDIDSRSIGEPQSIQYKVTQPGDISLIELINTVLRHRRMVVWMPTLLFIIVITYTFLQHRTYTAYASFIPQTSEAGRFVSSGLAAQLGITVPGSIPWQSIDFYADLIRSREILREVVESSYSFSMGTETFNGNLIELYDLTEDRYEVRCAIAIENLKKTITVGTGRETGLVTASTTSRWAPLSAQITRRILELVNEFNLESRQSQASAERTFIEERLKEVHAELRGAEDRLQEFLQKNRQFRESPELEFVHDRLLREVTMRQQVVTSLSQAYEQARIDEVRDTPVITVVEQPRVPVFPDPRRMKLKGLLAIVLGAMLGILLAFGLDLIQRSRQQDRDEIKEFIVLKEDTIEDLCHPWRLFLKSSTSGRKPG